MRIFERSLRNLLKDLTKIFARILEDPQGFDQDLAKILSEIQTRSLLGSFKILEDSMRMFERSFKESFEGSCKDPWYGPHRIFARILQDP